MAKPELIDRTALVEELERFKVSVPDPVLRLVVVRVIDRVKVQPVVEVEPVTRTSPYTCDSCAHHAVHPEDEPCASCGLGCRTLGRNWEAPDA